MRPVGVGGLQIQTRKEGGGGAKSPKEVTCPRPERTWLSGGAEGCSRRRTRQGKGHKDGNGNLGEKKGG